MNTSMFTDEEIKEQLKSLGFSNIPRDKFEMFKKDLVKLILNESAASQTSTSIQNDEIYTKAGLSKRRVTFPDEDSTASVMSNEDDYEEAAESSFVSITTTSSIVDNKLMKRKIARKVPIPVHHENKPQPSVDKLNNDLKNMHLKQVNSEAYSSATSFSTANDQIRVGPKQQLNHQYEEEEEEENTTTNDRSQVTIENQYYSDDENYFRLNDHYLPINYPVKSFIRSQSSLSIRSDASSMRGNANKSDPLRLYEKYRKTWTKQKAPGEKNHKDLRWSVREQMLEKHVVVKKPKVYVPNSYVIPTEKKRQQLRWVVRSALANPVS